MFNGLMPKTAAKILHFFQKCKKKNVELIEKLKNQIFSPSVAIYIALSLLKLHANIAHALPLQFGEGWGRGLSFTT